MKTICIFLAEGFEEMEAMFPLDVMRRGGLNVKTVSVTGEKTVVSSHQVPIVADMLFEDLKEEDEVGHRRHTEGRRYFLSSFQ
jgi:protein deglycase